MLAMARSGSDADAIAIEAGTGARRGIDSAPRVWYDLGMDTTTKTEEAVMETTNRDPFETLRENPFEEEPVLEEEPMFTIIDSHTNESVKPLFLDGADRDDSADPVLFDTELEAADWAAAHELDPKRYAIVITEDIIDEEV
jgi:hypothetical protein